MPIAPSGGTIRCPICRRAFGHVVPLSHYKEVHPEFLKWRTQYWRFLYPIAILMLAAWAFLALVALNILPIGIGNSLQMIIFLMSFAPLVAFFGIFLARTGKFRRAWEESNSSKGEFGKT